MGQPVEDPTVAETSTGPARRGGAGVGAPGRAGEGGAPGPARRQASGQRRHARVVIRKVGPWSVFKMSLIFYLCVMLVLLGAGVILYGMLGAMGALDSMTRLVRDLFSDRTFEIDGRWLFTRALGIGVVMVVVWSLINVFVAVLYNLIADLVGGIEVTLAERR
ncbi:hypothetical protein HRbin12_01615 [bacterium HR12]|nr:hypothetical protein HRbin12_01615 [bacterium HR12]